MSLSLLLSFKLLYMDFQDVKPTAYSFYNLSSLDCNSATEMVRNTKTTMFRLVRTLAL